MFFHFVRYYGVSFLNNGKIQTKNLKNWCDVDILSPGLMLSKKIKGIESSNHMYKMQYLQSVLFNLVWNLPLLLLKVQNGL